MTLLTFNWPSINRVCSGNPIKVYEYFYRLKTKSIKAWMLPAINSKEKDSFLINYKDLIDNKIGVSKLEIYQYIRLAAKRNIADYMLNRQTCLPMAMVDIDVSNLYIVKQQNNNLYFKYEGDNHGSSTR